MWKKWEEAFVNCCLSLLPSPPTLLLLLLPPLGWYPGLFPTNILQCGATPYIAPLFASGLGSITFLRPGQAVATFFTFTVFSFVKLSKQCDDEKVLCSSIWLYVHAPNIPQGVLCRGVLIRYIGSVICSSLPNQTVSLKMSRVQTLIISQL